MNKIQRLLIRLTLIYYLDRKELSHVASLLNNDY